MCSRPARSRRRPKLLKKENRLQVSTALETPTFQKAKPVGPRGFLLVSALLNSLRGSQGHALSLTERQTSPRVRPHAPRREQARRNWSSSRTPEASSVKRRQLKLRLAIKGQLGKLKRYDSGRRCVLLKVRRIDKDARSCRASERGS
jgi:hypothetical protein